VQDRPPPPYLGFTGVLLLEEWAGVAPGVVYHAHCIPGRGIHVGLLISGRGSHGGMLLRHHAAVAIQVGFAQRIAGGSFSRA
jgi:hypothetical protein